MYKFDTGGILISMDTKKSKYIYRQFFVYNWEWIISETISEFLLMEVPYLLFTCLDSN